MNSVTIALLGITVFYVGYRIYSKFLTEKIYGLDNSFITPAHELQDDVDYVPTKKSVLLGHHYSSIAGAAPIVGPAIAVIWGWLPAFLWVVLGSVFMGAVHDFGALVISLKHKGKSIGKITESILGPHSRTLFLIVIFLLVLIVIPVFSLIIAILFVDYPGSVIPINFEIFVAIIVGLTTYRSKRNMTLPSIIALLMLYFFIFIGWQYPVHITDFAGPFVKLFTSSQTWVQFLATGDYTLIRDAEILVWIHILMIYGFIASTLPVWILLQPRDYINSHQLIVGIGLIYLGLFFAHKPIVAPAFNMNPTGAPSFFPFIFITIACGAISGFHSLVSSGTTSKQVNKMTDARIIGYGGMLGEGLLALAAIMAATAGFDHLSAWTAHFESWDHSNALASKISAFVEGSSVFLSSIHIPHDLSVIFISVLIISFANTSLDTAFRIQRYVVGEFGEAYSIPSLSKNRYLQAGIATVTAYAIAMSQAGGKGGMILWPLFGGSNQLVGGLALLVISVWLFQQRKVFWYTLIPMIFLTIVTSIAIFLELIRHISEGNILLVVLSITILFCEGWIITEGIQAFRKKPM